MSICNSCGKENYGSTLHECALIIAQADPKARVVEAIRDGRVPISEFVASGIYHRLDSADLLAKPQPVADIIRWTLKRVLVSGFTNEVVDTLASEFAKDHPNGLLASAPVVPSVEELERVIGQTDLRGPGMSHQYAQAIRNHLLTLGYKDNSEALNALDRVSMEDMGNGSVRWSMSRADGNAIRNSFLLPLPKDPS